MAKPPLSKLPPLRTLPDGTVDYFDEVGQAADGVREFWAAGRESLKKKPHFPPGPGGGKDQAVKTLSARRVAGIAWNKETLRVARLFAGRCTETVLNRMLAQAQENGYIVGYTVMTNLFKVPNGKLREKLWQECLAHGWSVLELSRAIRRSCGSLAKVKRSGKTFDPPQSPEHARDFLRQESARFQRVYDALVRPAKGTLASADGLSQLLKQQFLEQKAKAKKDGAAIHALTARERQMLEAARRAMAELSKAVN